MKNNTASDFLKHIISMLCSTAKSKSMAIKSKTDAVKARLLVFSLLKNKNLSLASISHKIHAMVLGHDQHQAKGSGNQEEDDDIGDVDHDQSRAIVLYNNDALTNESHSSSTTTSHAQQLVEKRDDLQDDYYYYYTNDDKYPDLTHSLFDEELDLGDPNRSVIDLVRNSKEEGEDFSLEDEIDHVADLFIMKFRKRMRMQKLESFKRYQGMLERSA